MLRALFIRNIAANTFRATSRPQNVAPLRRIDHCRCLSAVKTVQKSSNTNITSNTQETTSAFENERDFLVRLKNDPDVFGGPPEPAAPVDPGDLEEDAHFEDQPLPSQQLSTKKYADIIKNYIRKRKIKEALDVLEHRMLKEDRAKPESYIYNLLIGACGRVGYSKKAFALFNQMKKRGLQPMGGTYTALFNACANSPWPEDGLTRARHLRELMAEKMVEPNDTNYNAMIKAFGRCGDISTAFAIADEMASKRKLKNDTINFLLQACISDKEAGFRHALLVWRKTVRRKIKPTAITFNLMLKATRDCGIGDTETTIDVIDKILATRKDKMIEGPDPSPKLLARSDSDNKSSDLISANTNLAQNDDSVAKINNFPSGELAEIEDKYQPNLMARVPHLGSVVSISEIKTAGDRLFLIGGLKGFLENMDRCQAVPDIKTFTQLLECLPENAASERELLGIMKKYNVKPDLDFYNMIIKRRSMRDEYEGARDVLKLIKKDRYLPDLITYGVLAIGCKTKDQGMGLLEEMREHSYTLNIEILGAMLTTAAFHFDFPYVMEIMEITRREEIKPSKKFMERLEKLKKVAKHISNDKDNPLYHSKKFQQGHRTFQMRYKTWIAEVEVDQTEDEHPWKQYRQTNDTDVRKYKDPALRFKPRHSSHFRVKTSRKHFEQKSK